ncbi:unnamed protein product [Mytilus coruscus]|uniref:Uncharacterized protein n=1 Tax=Mytilus coruscus TaxID=42192 RepID=A0A6J8BW60_MYTCO|nr:unnamed protein product [Mytilus coruscus]
MINQHTQKVTSLEQQNAPQRYSPQFNRGYRGNDRVFGRGRSHPPRSTDNWQSPIGNGNWQSSRGTGNHQKMQVTGIRGQLTNNNNHQIHQPLKIPNINLHNNRDINRNLSRTRTLHRNIRLPIGFIYDKEKPLHKSTKDIKHSLKRQDKPEEGSDSDTTSEDEIITVDPFDPDVDETRLGDNNSEAVETTDLHEDANTATQAEQEESVHIESRGK